VAPDAAAAVDSPLAAAGGVASSWGAALASGAPAGASADLDGDSGAADVAPGLPAEVEVAGWGQTSRPEIRRGTRRLWQGKQSWQTSSR
jgi:hypothetical protein